MKFNTFNQIFMKGLLIVLPFFLLLYLLKLIYEFILEILNPLVVQLPKFTLIGVEFPNLAAITFIILLILATGLLAQRTGFGQSFTKKIEIIIPGYLMLKNVLTGRLERDESKMKPCLAKIDDGWMFSFIMEKMDDGMYVVFIPDAPSITGGGVYVIHPNFVKPLNISKMDAIKSIMQFGIGANERLKGKVDWSDQNYSEKE